MPRDSSGNYSLPAGNPVVPNTVIASTWANNTLDDIRAAIEGSLDRQGRGAMQGALNFAPSVTFASAATVDIGAAAANVIFITGTTTISAFGTIPAGVIRVVVFTTQLTLTHNATSLALPGNDNLFTAPGDVAIMLSLGGGNWRCMGYQPVSGSAITPFKGGTLTGVLRLAPAVSVASAATTIISTSFSNILTITGTTTITAFDADADGSFKILTFANALTLTHNVTTLILPGGVNITTAAGDVAVMLSLGGGNWRCIAYERASGKAVVAHTTTINVPHTWAVAGEIKVPVGNLDVIPGFFVPPLAAGQTVKITAARHQIGAGTSATMKLQKNGVDITGFTALSVTTTSTLTDPADVALAAGDYVQLIVTAVSGAPKNLSFTVSLEYAAAGV